VGRLNVFVTFRAVLDDAANRGGESEPPDRTTEIKRTEHRPAVGLKNHGRICLGPCAACSALSRTKAMNWRGSPP